MLGVCVHLVVSPRVHVGRIYTEDAHASGRNVAVPLGTLSVLKQEILLADRRVDAIARVAQLKTLHREAALSVDGLRRGEAHGVTLIERIATRRATVVQVTAPRHDVKLSRIVGLPVLLVISVVEVGQAQHMGELMADGANTIHIRRLLRTVELSRAGAAAQPDAVFINILRLPKGAVLEQLRSVRPQQALVVARDVRATAGKEEVNHIDNTVFIAIVETEVDDVVGRVDDIPHQLHGVLAILFRVILAPVDHDRSDKVELGLEHAVGVVAIVVVDAACTLHPLAILVGVASVVLRVDHLLHDL